MIAFSVGNILPNTVFKFFPQKFPYRLNESQKTGFGGTFSSISVILFGRLFPKTIRFTRRWTRTNPLNFIKIGLELQPVSCVLLHIQIYIMRSEKSHTKLDNLFLRKSNVKLLGRKTSILICRGCSR